MPKYLRGAMALLTIAIIIMAITFLTDGTSEDFYRTYLITLVVGIYLNTYGRED